MIITTIIERILMAVSGILMIGYILVDLYVKKAMAECSKKFRYDFAFRYIVYDKDNVRDTMIDAVSSINTEISNKRKEYSLD